MRTILAKGGFSSPGAGLDFGCGDAMMIHVFDVARSSKSGAWTSGPATLSEVSSI